MTKLYKINVNINAHEQIFQGEMFLMANEDCYYMDLTTQLRDIFNCKRDDVTMSSISTVELGMSFEEIY